MADIIVDIVTDTARLVLEDLPNKNVLFQSGLMTMNPPRLRGALDMAGRSGDRIRIPRFTFDTADWEVAKLTSADYSANSLAQTDEYGIVTRRRKYFEGLSVDDMRRVHGDKFEIEVGRQLGASSIAAIDKAFMSILDGAVPTATNEYDNSANGAGTITVDSIIEAEKLLGDNGSKLKYMVCHSKVWADLRKLQFSSYSAAQLLNPGLQSGNSVWLAGGKIVYVTDKCKLAATKYSTYLLGEGQLQFAPLDPVNTFRLVVDTPRAKNELIGVRGDLDFVAHLAGAEYLSGSPVNPTDANLADTTKWGLGIQDAKSLLAVRLLTK